MLRNTGKGQAATEYMLVISVVVIAAVSAAYAFVPRFRSGVRDLAMDVSEILDQGAAGMAATRDDPAGACETGNPCGGRRTVPRDSS